MNETIAGPHVLRPDVDFKASRKYHPIPTQSTTHRPTALSLMKNEFEMESPKSADMDSEMARIFERDHQPSFEKEILAIIECKNPEIESIESRWRGLRRKVLAALDLSWKHDPQMLLHLQQCAADLFARIYFREFTENPKNKKYKEQGSIAILAQMKVELSGLKVWSCVYKGLEWRVYDEFGDPEEASPPNEAEPVDMALLSRAIKSLNKPWNLSGTAVTPHGGRHPTSGGVHNPPLPNISCRLPILTRPPIVREDPPPTAGAEVPKKAPIRLKIRIPPRQAPVEGVVETPQSLTRAHKLPTQPTVIPTPGTDVRGLEKLPFFLRFLALRCDRSDKLWRTLCTDVYADYAFWAPKANAPVMGKNQIGAELRKHGIYSQVFSGRRYYVGIRLKYLTS